LKETFGGNGRTCSTCHSEDVVDVTDVKHGACAACHSGPMLNESNQFAELAFGIPRGTRFQTIGVSELNALGNPVHDYVFTGQECVQDADALGRGENGALLPRQLGEDARGRRCALRSVLQHHERARRSRSHPAGALAHATGPGGHRVVSEAAEVATRDGACRARRIDAAFASSR
jgi:hypothetical protein